MTAPVSESELDFSGTQIPQLMRAVSLTIDALFRQFMRKKPRPGDLALILAASAFVSTAERYRKGAR